MPSSPLEAVAPFTAKLSKNYTLDQFTKDAPALAKALVPYSGTELEEAVDYFINAAVQAGTPFSSPRHVRLNGDISLEAKAVLGQAMSKEDNWTDQRRDHFLDHVSTKAFFKKLTTRNETKTQASTATVESYMESLAAALPDKLVWALKSIADKAADKNYDQEQFNLDASGIAARLVSYFNKSTDLQQGILYTRLLLGQSPSTYMAVKDVNFHDMTVDAKRVLATAVSEQPECNQPMREAAINGLSSYWNSQKGQFVIAAEEFIEERKTKPRAHRP